MDIVTHQAISSVTYTVNLGDGSEVEVDGDNSNLEFICKADEHKYEALGFWF